MGKKDDATLRPAESRRKVALRIVHRRAGQVNRRFAAFVKARTAGNPFQSAPRLRGIAGSTTPLSQRAEVDEASNWGLMQAPMQYPEEAFFSSLLSQIAPCCGRAGGGWFALEYPFKSYGDQGADYRACDVNPTGAHVAADQIGGE
jgi:hypothetical protein